MLSIHVLNDIPLQIILSQPKFMTERLYFRREYASRYYGWLPFALCPMLVEMPYIIFFCKWLPRLPWIDVLIIDVLQLLLTCADFIGRVVLPILLRRVVTFSSWWYSLSFIPLALAFWSLLLLKTPRQLVRIAFWWQVVCCGLMQNVL